jgi:hypothetical protein
MVKYITTFCLVPLIIAIILAHGFAEKTTELYIPIGKSPGLSDKHTLLGKIEAVDEQNQTILVEGASENHTVHISELTRIFLDKSRLHKANSYGAFSDLRPGLVVEVRFEADKYQRPAEWIKLQFEE